MRCGVSFEGAGVALVVAIGVGVIAGVPVAVGSTGVTVTVTVAVGRAVGVAPDDDVAEGVGEGVVILRVPGVVDVSEGDIFCGVDAIGVVCGVVIGVSCVTA